MVNIVVVSHSARLAAGVVELAEQMNHGGCRIAVAAGIDDETSPIGTDAIKVMMAIESVFEPAGVLVLMDLGSAVLSTETALELLSPAMRSAVMHCSAPLVEGTVAAVVAAATGGSLLQVRAEAMGALQAKQRQVGDEQGRAVQVSAAVPLSHDAESRCWKVQNAHGLHARPAARLAEKLAHFDAQLVLACNGNSVNPRSLNQLALLQVRHGDTICLSASGKDAQAALAAFVELAEQHFGESPVDKLQVSLHGQPVIDSVVNGPVLQLKCQQPVFTSRQITGKEIESEQLRLHHAIQQTLADISLLAERTASLIGRDQAAIFSSHQMLLDDPDLQQQFYARIAQQRCCAESALYQEMMAVVAQYRSLEDEYLRVRELDVRDILRRTLSHLCHQPLPGLALTEPVIIVADELMPSDTALLDRRWVHGICLSGGSPISHSAILAQAMGIPMVVQVSSCLTQTEPDQWVMLDAARGVLLLGNRAE